jgi:hypothetical protein
MPPVPGAQAKQRVSVAHSRHRDPGGLLVVGVANSQKQTGYFGVRLGF